MAVFGTLARRLWTLVRRRQVDGDVDQEMHLHLALLQQQLRDGGDAGRPGSHDRAPAIRQCAPAAGAVPRCVGMDLAGRPSERSAVRPPRPGAEPRLHGHSGADPVDRYRVHCGDVQRHQCNALPPVSGTRSRATRRGGAGRRARHVPPWPVVPRVSGLPGPERRARRPGRIPPRQSAAVRRRCLRLRLGPVCQSRLLRSAASGRGARPHVPARRGTPTRRRGGRRAVASRLAEPLRR